uniref:Poly(3-hydroxyalkanoate) polymerase subunit PhaE n=1 Tax=Candidatus Kentrum sp. MB TaxID=2138164 RepID=A0A450XWJ0_9GAMM|nr:MAG: poly(R)-hydroxyalkanoic acid synthase, class III, PhaE subunit [Candidatus Kentron sp. MB]VFK33640.1 MAG: poly(R)-hydroxyalkanoic acid synthase, class III, PhaE subunit [Candidatus Kentron sp. MB]VFK76341.1 MAG: poly(R)-hydroxyalkanoic acid synthase, class III, PhaE subunit [Candidatus Kentron sp. MB]
MNWTEQAESMMKMWDDTQRQLLGGWYNFGHAMSSLPGFPTMPNLPDFASWLTPESLSGTPWWRAGGGDAVTGKAAAGNLFATQAMMMQGLGMLTKAWQAISPSLSAGKPWQPDFDAFLKEWRDEVMGAPERLSKTGTGMKDLMTSFFGEWGPLLKPWLASIQGVGLGGPMGDMLTGEQFPFKKMFGMGMDPAFQDIAQIPMMGVSREQIAKISRLFDSHVDLRKAVYKYQMAMGKSIGEALKETMEKLVELSQKDEQISSVRELMRIWVRITDKKLTQMYVTDEFISVQSELSKASLEGKLAQRAVLEMILTQFDIPTRTELDDAYKTLYNLKKGVKDLQADTVDVRNGHKQVEAEMMELRNARKQAEVEAKEMRDGRKRAEAEAAELRGVSKKLESEVASLRDTLQKTEARLAREIAQVAESVTASKPAAEVKAHPKPVSAPPPVKSGEKDPVAKTINKKA